MKRWVGNRQVESRTPGYPHLNMRPTKAKTSRLMISAPTDFRHIDGSGAAASTPNLVKSESTSTFAPPPVQYQSKPTSVALPAPPVTLPSFAVRVAQINTQPSNTLRRKPAFRPLQLSIYQPDNQLSPLPDFGRNSWDRRIDQLAFPGEAHVRRRTESMCSEAAFRIPRKPIPSYVEGWFGDDGADDDGPLRPVMMRSSTMPMPDRPRTMSADVYARERATPSPLPVSGAPSPRMRSNTEPMEPPRSLRKQPSYRTPRDSIEDAISELNLIVEERRAQKTASNSPKQHHVPALAPNFKMHVRSETLSDIGSALSVPFTSKPLPSVPPSPVVENDRDSAYDSPVIRSVGNSQSDLLTHFPTPPDPTSASRNTTPRARLAKFMQRRRNNASVDTVDTVHTYTSSKLSHTRTATDDTFLSFASSATAASISPFYQASALTYPSDNMYCPTSPSVASTTANCPTNSTISTPATICSFHGDDTELEEIIEITDTRSATPDTIVSIVDAPLPAGVSQRTLLVPSFGVAMEVRERQGKSWNAVVEELDAKSIESGEFLTFPPVYDDVDFDSDEERGRSMYSAVGVAF